jgi:oligopeptide/dipeptide ABC transporter ATP-binding protein
VSPSIPPLLVAQGLHKSYGRGGSLWGDGARVRALRGVDLEIAAGETFALVGESGSGKSTLGRLILRLEEPDAGELRFAGLDLLRLRGRALRRVRPRFQAVFQDPLGSLTPGWTVQQHLAAVLRLHALVARAELTGETDRLLREVGLPPELGQRYPHELSGGQRQRVGIARALATQPELIVADEPTSALDVSTQRRILELLRELQRERGLALLWISHDLRVVRRLARRGLVLLGGRPMEEGPLDELICSPEHPYTRLLVAAVPGLRGPGREPAGPTDGPGVLAGALPSSAPRTVADAAGCPFAARCPERLPRCRETPPPPVVTSGRRVWCHRRG